MKGGLRSAARRLLAAAALAATLSCREEVAPQPAETPKSGAAAAATPAKPPAPAAIAVADIPVEAERFEALRREITASLTPGTDLADIDVRLSRGQRRASPSIYASSAVRSAGRLQDMDLVCGTWIRSAQAPGDADRPGRGLETDLERLAGRRWNATVPGSPPERRRRPAPGVAGRLLVRPLRASSNAAGTKLTQLDRVTRVRSSLETARAEMAGGGAPSEGSSEAPGPIWRMALAGRQVGQAAGNGSRATCAVSESFWRKAGRPSEGGSSSAF